MNTEYSAFPLQWPTGFKRTPAAQREWGHFKGTPDRIRRELLQEINRLVMGKEASRWIMNRGLIVISSNVPLRRDGEPVANAREPDDCGVAVYFQRKKQWLAFACDRFDRVWKNMRAIQLTIGALRGIERWGSSALMEQAFTGFAALPEKRGLDCWETLGLPQTATEEQVLAAYREKAKKAHPDAGGSVEEFTKISEARDIALATIRSGR